MPACRIDCYESGSELCRIVSVVLQQLDDGRQISETMLVGAQQRIENLRLDGIAPTIPELLALQRGVDDARRIARAEALVDAAGKGASVRERVLRLVAGRATHAPVRAQPGVEEKVATERDLGGRLNAVCAGARRKAQSFPRRTGLRGVLGGGRSFSEGERPRPEQSKRQNCELA